VILLQTPYRKKPEVIMRLNPATGKVVCFLVFVIFFYVFAGCSAADLATEYGHINGIVKDTITKQPISGVYVSTDYYDDWYNDGDYDYTDGGGQYVLTLDSGTYDIRYEKQGYYDVTLTDISVISPFSQSRDIEMEPVGATPTPTPTPVNSTRLFATLAGSMDLFQAFFVDKDSGNIVGDSSSPVGTGRSPAGVLFYKSKSRILTANSGDNTMSIYSSYTGYLPVTGSPFVMQETDGQPYLMAYDETSNQVFVSRKGSSNPGKVEVIDMTNPSLPVLKGRLNISDLASDPQCLRTDTINRQLYIASVNGNMITSWDIAGNTKRGMLSIDSPIAISLDESGNRLFAAKGNTNTVSVIDISNPASMKKLGDTAVSSDASARLIDCEYAPGKSLLFAAQSLGASYYISIWKTDVSVPVTQAQSNLYLGNSTVSDIAFDPSSGFLYAAHDGTAGYGIRVYDCRSYPGGQIYEVSGSPFFGGNRYFKLGF
jgi:DNA-binding beta-propeller fold protein YncE